MEHFPESFSVMRIETYGTPFDFSDLKFTFLRDDPICPPVAVQRLLLRQLGQRLVDDLIHLVAQRKIFNALRSMTGQCK